MKTFNDILNELAEPKARKEKEFKDKHIVQKIDHPVTDMDALTAKSAKKDKTKKASLHDDEDEAVYEEKMSDAEMKKREDIVMGMKKSKADLKKRYGDRWKSVMYATATKNAMKEAVELDEKAPKIKDDMIKKERERNRAHDAAMGRTPTGRKKPVRQMTSTQSSLAKMRREEVELDEAVEVSHDRYMRSHGKKASGGHGLWMFTHKRMGDANVNDPKEVHSAQGKFSDAVKSAKAWAKKHGHSTAYVMESVDLNEDISKMSHSRLKWHMNTGVPHGSYTKDEMKKERDRRLSRVDTHAAYKKAKPMLEEIEQIDELSKKTLGSYVKKASRDVAQRSASNARDYAKSGAKPGMNQKALKNWKREIGIDKAVDRITKEEVERLDELSPNTLHSYIKKASGNLAGNAAVAATQASSSMKKSSPDVKRKMVNRMKGITGASGRLADKANMANEEYMDEAFKAGSMKLADGSSVKVTTEQANVLNSLFKELNSSNKKKMEERLMSGSKGFNEILSFAKEAL